LVATATRCESRHSCTISPASLTVRLTFFPWRQPRSWSFSLPLLSADEKANRVGIRKADTVQERVNDAHWSLAMALAWLTYRTEQAVINIKHGRWAPTEAAVRDLLSALRSGKLIAHGMFEGERIPHPIETAVWSTFEIIVKPTRFAGHRGRMPIVVARRMGPPNTQLLSPTVPAAKIRKLWPVARPSAAAETRCQAYLVAEMQRTPDRAPKPKAAILADCQSRFPDLSERGFDRAWAHAIIETGAHWRRGGRPRHPRTSSAT
jgi:hypothetical protein